MNYLTFRGIENKFIKCNVNSITQLFFHNNVFLSYLDSLQIDTENETENFSDIENDF